MLFHTIGDGMEPERSMSLLGKTFVEEVSTALEGLQSAHKAFFSLPNHPSVKASPTIAAASEKLVENKPTSDIGKCFVGFVNFVQCIYILYNYILPESQSYPFKPTFSLLGTSGWLAIKNFSVRVQ